MPRVVLLILAFVVCGCVDHLAQRQAFLNQLVGQPERVVVQTMGVPNRTFETGGVRFLAYEERRIETLPSAPMGPWWYGGWYGGGFPPQLVTRVCETTIAIQDGVVKSYTLRGNACG